MPPRGRTLGSVASCSGTRVRKYRTQEPTLVQTPLGEKCESLGSCKEADYKYINIRWIEPRACSVPRDEF